MAQNSVSVSLLLLVEAVFAPEPSQAATVPVAGIAECLRGNAMHFTYLGFLTTPSFVRENIEHQTSFYFRSENAQEYATAISECIEFLGQDCNLVSIETPQELSNVTEIILGSGGTASSYWVGGKWDGEKLKLVWESGVEFEPWVPWDEGHPDTNTSATRVYARPVGGIAFRTQNDTVSTRYICELKTGAEPCYHDNDLVVVVDSSGSIGQTHYMAALEFTTKLAIAWAQNTKNRLSVIVYSNNVQSIFSLAQNPTVIEIRNLVHSAPYFAGGTASDLGLDRAVQEFQQNPRSVPKNLVFLTGGRSDNSSATLAAAQRVQAAGIRSFAVGIGTGIVASELLVIAGNNPDHVFNTDGFDDLLKLLRPVSRCVCDSSEK